MKQFEFVGVSTRSRTGCINCRQRRKKCDEIKPICGLCSSRKSNCIWREAPKSLTAKVAISQRQTSKNGINKPTPNITRKLSNQEKSIAHVDEDASINLQSKPPLFEPSLPYSSDLEMFPLDRNIVNRLSHIFKRLDSTQVVYFNNYCYNALVTSVIGPESNAYINRFIKMAETSEIVLLAILTAGSIMTKGKLEAIDMSPTLKLIETLLHTSPSPNKIHYNLAISSYIILMEAQIIKGSIGDWEYLFGLLKKLLHNLGLLDRIVNGEPDYTINILEDEKWILVNLIHHDLFSSLVNVQGTSFPEKLLSYPELQGVGTLHGVTKPILTLFAECINLGLEARRKYKLLEVPGKLNNFRTTAELNRIVDSTSDLDARFATLKPRAEDISLVPKKTLEDHLSLYELYQFMGQAYLRLAVKRMAPITPEIQIYLYKIINLLHILVDSDVNSGIKLPFLIAGICCVYEFDRKKVMYLLQEYQKKLHYHSNIKFVKQLIEESWKINPEGTLCIDWYEVAFKFGWSICLS